MRGMNNRVFMALAIVFVAMQSAQAQQDGRLAKFKPFQSKFVDAREVDVWLPPEYDQKQSAKFPVLYMHDGQNLFDSHQSYTGVPWGVDKAITELAAAGKIRAAIVVGIWNTPKRFGEYMPGKAVKATNTSQLAGIPFPTHDDIVSDNYLKFIVTELKPFIDAHYRTLPDRADTFMMGSSMGGLISAYAVTEYPNVFGGAACLSTHWPIADGAVVTYLASHLPDPATHKLYFDHGNKTLDAQYAPYQERMDAAMRSAGYQPGVNWVSKIYPGADHSERSWSQRLHVPLEFLLKKEN
jgi:predicted alpha/beta superfamily hydrolase